MSMTFLQRVTAPLRNAARAHRGRMLAKYGLRADDLLDPLYDEDVAEALELLPERERVLRTRRLVRALDLSVKHEKLPEHVQAIQEPFNDYLTPYIEQVKARRLERANYE